MKTTESPRQYRVKGTTNDVTECAYCGRQELKGTVVLEVLDADGNAEGVTYFGTGCAATAGRRTVKEIKTEAKSADAAARIAERDASEEASRVFCAARDAWIAENIAPDALNRPRAYGYTSTVAIVQAFIAATGQRP